VNVFLAPLSIKPGSSWPDELWHAIRSCRVFVLVVTAETVKSKWCLLEIGAALGLRKPLVAVLRHSTKLPDVLKTVQAGQGSDEKTASRLRSATQEHVLPLKRSDAIAKVGDRPPHLVTQTLQLLDGPSQPCPRAGRQVLFWGEGDRVQAPGAMLSRRVCRTGSVQDHRQSMRRHPTHGLWLPRQWAQRSSCR
jgi:hypothetical protein